MGICGTITSTFMTEETNSYLAAGKCAITAQLPQICAFFFAPVLQPHLDGTIGIESSDCILTSLQKTLRIFWGTLPNCHLLKNFYSTSELAFQSAFSFVQTSVILIRVNHSPP